MDRCIWNYHLKTITFHPIYIIISCNLSEEISLLLENNFTQLLFN